MLTHPRKKGHLLITPKMSIFKVNLPISYNWEHHSRTHHFIGSEEFRQEQKQFIALKSHSQIALFYNGRTAGVIDYNYIVFDYNHKV